MRKFYLSILMIACSIAPARAGICLSYEAAYTIERRVAEGLSWKQALQTVVDEEYSDGSSECLKSIKQEIQQTPYAFPMSHKALYKRTTR